MDNAHAYLLGNQKHIDGAQVEFIVKGHGGETLIGRMHAGIKLAAIVSNTICGRWRGEGGVYAP